VKLPAEYRSFDFLSPWEGARYALPGQGSTYLLPGDEKAVPPAGGKLAAPVPPPAPSPKTSAGR
jgi:NADH-quinone oxidoreductase subunit C